MSWQVTTKPIRSSSMTSVTTASTWRMWPSSLSSRISPRAGRPPCARLTRSRAAVAVGRRSTTSSQFMPSSSGAGRPTIGSTAGVTCTIVRSWSRMQITSEAYCSISRSRRSLRRSTMISPTSSRSSARCIVEASDCRADDGARRRRQLDGDDGAFAGRPAGRQRDEDERPGRGHAEGRVQQRRAGEDVDALLVLREQLAARRSRGRWPGRRPRWPGRRCRPGRRRSARTRLPGWSSRSMAAVRAASRTPAAVGRADQRRRSRCAARARGAGCGGAG